MKRERVVMELYMEEGVSKAKIKSGHNVTKAKTIIDILDELNDKKSIKKAKKINKENFTDFVYDINDEKNYSIVVRIDNKEKADHHEIIKNLENLCDLSISLKKVNRTRFAAGLAIGTLILVSIGSVVVTIKKENDEIKNKPKDQYEDVLEDTSNYGRYYPSEEEKKAAQEDYYEALKQRAENGDEKAKAEYEDYLLEQMVIEQIELEQSENNHRIK